MKSKLLPISLFVLILGFTTIILASGWVDNPPARVNQQGNSAMQASLDYLNKLRANQVTGKIDPLDVMNARLQVEQMQFKSGNELGLGWEEMGPDNAPGRVRAILVDEKADNDQTLIVAGVSGGFWKTENLGATWAKLNKENENLYITCMAQAPDGTIYAGSGEAFCSDNDTYYGGFVGQGMYISGDRNNFTLLTSTVPVVTQENDTVDWAYINKIAIDMEGRIYAATNTGLFYSDDKGSSWMKAVKYVYDTAYFDVTLAIDTSIMCDSWDTTGGVFVATNKQYEVDTTVYTRAESSRINEILEFGKEMCTDVKVADDGQVFATIGNLVYSAPKATMVFTNHSHNPDNPDIISQEKNIFTTTLHAIDTLGQEYIRGVLNYTETLPFEPFVDYTIVQTSAGFALVNAISPLSFNPGRTSVAIAPSDNNVVYVLGSDQFGTLDNIYVSENRGLTWEIIFPGGSNLEIFDGTSCFNNTISVFPEDPYRLLVGGEDMWYGIKYAGGGYYNWGAGPITNGFNVPSGHHQYVFARNSNSKIAIATNRGVSFGIINTAGNYDFQNFVRGLSNTQSYTVGISGTKHGLLTGAQDNGTFYISGYGNTHTSSIKIDNFIGGSCAISLIDTNAFLFGRYNPSIGAGQKNFILRSEDKGANTSFNFTINAGTIFKAPFTLWESFDDQTSPDSVKYKAGKGYSKGDKIYAESANAGYPIPYVLTDTLHQGDSIYVNDYIQAKFFVALAGGIFVTKDVIKFGREINVGSGNLRSNNIWKIADASGFPTCISYSKDANYVFVGSEDGSIIRIANIALANDSLTADIGSSECIVASDYFDDLFPDRIITSISIDQQNPANVIVTLGNYGNESYIYKTTNALDSAANVVFTDITGNLPHMPVYSSLIEMKHSNIGIIGTENGIWTTDNLMDDPVIWTLENNGMGTVPVFEIKQQAVFKNTLTVPNPVEGEPPLVYPEIKNFGNIYVATFGRGVFRTEKFISVGIEDHNIVDVQSTQTLFIYPNPVVNSGTLNMEFTSAGDAMVSIYDLSGRLVINKPYHIPAPGSHNLQIDCSVLSTGTYLVRIMSGNDSGSGKLIIR